MNKGSEVGLCGVCGGSVTDGLLCRDTVEEVGKLA